MMQTHLIGRVATLGLLAALAGGGSGCVERKLTIASDPPGAVVWVNDVELGGRTPVTTPFLWYGDYDIRMRLERPEGTAAATQPSTQAGTQPAPPPPQPTMVQYELHTHRQAKAPWFQWLGVDLVTEIIPVEFKDEKVWAFTIPPVPQESDEQLVHNAKELQQRLSAPSNLPRNAAVPTSGPSAGPGK